MSSMKTWDAFHYPVAVHSFWIHLCSFSVSFHNKSQPSELMNVWRKPQISKSYTFIHFKQCADDEECWLSVFKLHMSWKGRMELHLDITSLLLHSFPIVVTIYLWFKQVSATSHEKEEIILDCVQISSRLRLPFIITQNHIKRQSRTWMRWYFTITLLPSKAQREYKRTLQS